MLALSLQSSTDRSRSREGKPFLWRSSDMRFGIIDRQLQLPHEPPHFDHRLLGVASAADHIVISIGHDLRAKSKPKIY